MEKTRKTDVYALISRRIVQLLEEGTVPWRMQWKGGGDGPKNIFSGRAYRGINAFLLNTMKYPTQNWMTFAQARKIGAKVKRGEKATPIVFWRWIEIEKDEESKQIPFLKHYWVFNEAQIEGIPEKVKSPDSPEKSFVSIKLAEDIVNNMPKAPIINHGGDKAAYVPENDTIRIPKPEWFHTPEHYYCTLFHEMVHATGHPSRLARPEVSTSTGFGSDPYAKEELVAEMGASFLSGFCGIEQRTLENSAAYIKGWLRSLRDDPKMVVYAAARAQKACDYIRNQLGAGDSR